MEEILAHFKGVVWVSLYSTKNEIKDCLDRQKFVLEKEHDTALLVEQIRKCKNFNIVLHKKKNINLENSSILGETSYDCCLISGKNHLLVRDMSKFNVALLDSQTNLLIYPHGLERFFDHKTGSYSEYYYIVPVIVVLVFVYLIERNLKVQGKQTEDGF